MTFLYSLTTQCYQNEECRVRLEKVLTDKRNYIKIGDVGFRPRKVSTNLGEVVLQLRDARIN